MLKEVAPHHNKTDLSLSANDSQPNAEIVSDRGEKANENEKDLCAHVHVDHDR